MNAKASVVAIFFALALSVASAPRAQSIVSEDFTGTGTNSDWYFFNGACLTAGTSTSTTSPGTVPGCGTILSTYYNKQKDGDAAMVGGNSGYLGSSSAPSSITSQVADPTGFGALRFTNGRPYGHNENGAIVGPKIAFPTGAGVQITFKTLTYRGDSGGNGATGAAHQNDGADGISFYLMDGSVAPGIGSWGGSLGYSCSNSNSPYDGLVGAYLGLGIDEFGNFLNGTVNTLNVTSPQSLGDNTASGGGQYANRIGLRGAGSISWANLTSLYGTNPNDTTKPYYPSTLAQTCASGTVLNSLSQCASCASGTYVLGTNSCDSCTTGAFVSGTNMCASCPPGATYVSSNQTCLSTSNCPGGSYLVTSGSTSNCDSCPAGYNFNTGDSKCYSTSACPSGGGYTFYGSNVLTQQCAKCTNSGYSYNLANNDCENGSRVRAASYSSPATATTIVGSQPTTSAPATQVAATQNTPTTVNPTNANALLAVKNTCKTGLLYNWSTGSGVATTTPIMDYPAISGGNALLSASGPIANEGATTRSDAVPILYNLKITQDGLLSLSYSYNGGATTKVLTNQSITASNGTLPTSFRFGFAGSTGGASNIHEIVCFKATPAQSSNSSGSVNVYQNPTLKNGTTQLFLAYYFPSDWTGQLTAQSIGFDTTANSIVVNTLPNWDARCVLTGVNAITGKCSTGVASQTAESPDSRVMLTWNGTTGIPFRYASLSTAQQSAMTAGTALSSPADRVNYLRGDRTNEVNSSGVGEFRARDSVLGDIINSSPQWLGPPQQPYEVMNSWVDKLYATANPPENATTRSYVAYQSTEASRANIVYVGANDGFLHGFRAGALDASGNLVTTTTPNDGSEVLAYMPATVLNNIHPVDSGGNVIAPLDYSSTQYGHNYFVDATPAVGDIFFNGKWHTWLVGGLGAGGAAIYVLNVTDPSQFSESTPAYNPLTDTGVVVGEWTPATLKCVGNSGCGANLGNTYGTPEIRRFHNGQWGAIIGNGFGSANGNAGIYIMLFNDDGSQSIYFLGTNSQTANGIASPASLDIDLDHIVDYIYAGDLLGHVWRFDVTSQTPANWAVSASSPLFTTGTGQPITTRPTVGTLKTITTSTTLAGTTLSTAPERVIIDFGTGQQIGQTLSTATQYASGQQYLYGIWDWDMGTQSVAGSGWNWLSRNGQQALSLTSLGTQTISTSNMVKQTVTTEVAAAGTTPGYRKVSHNTICWTADPGCSATAGNLGWYMPLPDSGEQVVFDPVLSPDGEFTVNTFVPSPSSILSCTVTPASGWSMGIQADTGAGSPTPFFAINGSLAADGIQLNGTGTPSFLSSGQAADNNSEYLITQTNSGPAPPTKVNRHVIVAGQRLNWIQRR
ncbi:MAG TPA: PilC/PilY family type IV pilus protein [Steroidobacteraceae bacterium]|nr:PilC/PilY family type IV pilus protein [Steroidobacteraceae bacterium]